MLPLLLSSCVLAFVSLASGQAQPFSPANLFPSFPAYYPPSSPLQRQIPFLNLTTLLTATKTTTTTSTYTITCTISTTACVIGRRKRGIFDVEEEIQEQPSPSAVLQIEPTQIEELPVRQAREADPQHALLSTHHEGYARQFAYPPFYGPPGPIYPIAGISDNRQFPVGLLGTTTLTFTSFTVTTLSQSQACSTTGTNLQCPNGSSSSASSTSG